jgi:hypothetical protein
VQGINMRLKEMLGDFEAIYREFERRYFADDINAGLKLRNLGAIDVIPERPENQEASLSAVQDPKPRRKEFLEVTRVSDG